MTAAAQRTDDDPFAIFGVRGSRRPPVSRRARLGRTAADTLAWRLELLNAAVLHELGEFDAHFTRIGAQQSPELSRMRERLTGHFENLDAIADTDAAQAREKLAALEEDFEAATEILAEVSATLDGLALASMKQRVSALVAQRERFLLLAGGGIPYTASVCEEMRGRYRQRQIWLR